MFNYDITHYYLLILNFYTPIYEVVGVKRFYLLCLSYVRIYYKDPLMDFIHIGTDGRYKSKVKDYTKT